MKKRASNEAQSHLELQNTIRQIYCKNELNRTQNEKLKLKPCHEYIWLKISNYNDEVGDHIFPDKTVHLASTFWL